jgi:uncharacterized protein YndB with AHSA1/START domain
MAVDISSEIVIDRPRNYVAEYAANPSNAPGWYASIQEVEWKSPQPLRVGSRVAFVARFLGRRMAYTYEVVDFVPGERLVMRASEGPFPMETTYTWESTPDGGTRMQLRNRGEPRGFPALMEKLMTRAVRNENRKDLAALKSVLESAGSTS